jgi:hypothetical protein
MFCIAINRFELIERHSNIILFEQMMRVRESL